MTDSHNLPDFETSSPQDQEPAGLAGAGDPHAHPPAEIYEIHVRGHLCSDWAEWLESFEMRLLDNGEMILYGPIVDQSALLGVINKLSRLNLTLLSINPVKPGTSETERNFGTNEHHTNHQP